MNPKVAFQDTDRFQVLSRLGAGGMGVVYAVLDRQRHERVALKTLLEPDPHALLRLKNEFRSLQDLHHPNLVSLGELFETEGCWYFTMELVVGSDLISYVRPPPTGPLEEAPSSEDLGPTLVDGAALPTEAGPRHDPGALATVSPPLPSRPALDVTRLRAVLLQLVDGLATLHASGRVHRDIKPSNVLVARDGRVVIMDLGLVSRVDPGELSTEHEGPIGTVAYMAPEQAASAQVGPAADGYSVGVMLYEALTGRLPYAGTLYQVILAKHRETPPPPRALWPGVPADLDALCVKLLSLDPAARPDAEAIRAALLSSTAVAPGPTPPAASERRLTRAPVFLGREAELAALQKAYDRSRHGASVVLVHGASGLGKTELVRVFVQSVRDAQPEATVLVGRCYERESVPFKAFDGVVDSLSRLLQRLPERDVLPLVPRDAALLLRLFPVLGRVKALESQPGPRRVVEDVQMIRTLAFDALRELLTRLADRHPLLLVVDDVQWSDEDSRRLLRSLLQPPDAPCCCLIATLRTPVDPAEARERVTQARGAFPDKVREVPVGPLPRDTAIALARRLVAESIADEAAQAALAGRVAEEAQGHPFFIQELVRHVEEGGSSGSRESVSLDQVIGARVAALEPQVRALVELLCVHGGRLPQNLAAEILAQPLADTTRQVAQLRWMNLLRSHGPRPEDDIEPYHDRVRESVSRQLEAEVRRDWHRRLFEALKQTGTAPAERLALHLEEAGDRHQAARYSARAAEEAAGLLAFDRAAALLRKALADWPETATPEAQEERRLLVVKLAEALAMAGRGGEAASAYLEAAPGASAAERLHLEHLAAGQLLMSGRIDDGLDVTERVLLLCQKNLSHDGVVPYWRHGIFRRCGREAIPRIPRAARRGGRAH